MTLSPISLCLGQAGQEIGKNNMASSPETGVTNPGANGGNPGRQLMLLVNSHVSRESSSRSHPCHQDVLPDVPTPERLNSLLPTFEVLTDEMFTSVIPTPMYSATSVQFPNVQTDRIYNTPPLSCNINGSGQTFSEARDEGIMTITSTTDWGLHKFASTDQRVTEPPNRTLPINGYTAADSHRRFDSKSTQESIWRSGKLKSTKCLANNSINYNYTAPLSLRQFDTHSGQRKQIPSSIVTELKESISCMESHIQLVTSNATSTTELATENLTKPLSFKHCETNDKKQNERNNRKGIDAVPDILINKASHKRTEIQGNPSWIQMQGSYQTPGNYPQKLASSNKSYILITSRIKNVIPRRRTDNVTQDPSRPLMTQTTICSSENKPQNKATNTPALISLQGFLNNPINKSHASKDHWVEYDNPTFLKLSKDAGFPDSLPPPYESFLAAILCEDNEPFDEWFAASLGDIGPSLKEFIIEGSNNNTQSKAKRGTQNRESKFQPDKGSVEDTSGIKTNKSVGDNGTGCSLPQTSESDERLKFERKDEEDKRKLRSPGRMGRVTTSNTSDRESSSVLTDDKKDENGHQVKEKFSSEDSELPVELADRQYSLSVSPSKNDVLTLKSLETEGGMSSNPYREGSVSEDHVAEVSTARDVCSENGKGGSKTSQIVAKHLSRQDKDSSNSAFVMDACNTSRISSEGNTIVTQVNGRRESLRSEAGTLINLAPGHIRFPDTSVAMRKPDKKVQGLTKLLANVMSVRPTSPKPSTVKSVMQQRKCSTRNNADVDTNQNCSRDRGNEIEPAFDSKEVVSNKSSREICPQIISNSDEQPSMKPCARQSTIKNCSEYSTPNLKNESKIKATVARDYVDIKRKDTASTDGKPHTGEEYQAPSNNSLISDVKAKGKDTLSQPRRNHDYNLRSCNRYKNKPSENILQNAHTAKVGHELSVKCQSEKEMTHGVLQIQCDYQTNVKGCGQEIRRYQSNTDECFGLEERTFNIVEQVSYMLSGRPSGSSRKTKMEQKSITQPTNRKTEQTPLFESKGEPSPENDQDQLCNVANTFTRNRSGADIDVHQSCHSPIGHATIDDKEEEPSYLTRHFIRNLELFPQNQTSLSVKQRNKSKAKMGAAEENKSITPKCSGQELDECKRFQTLRSRMSSGTCVKSTERNQERFPSKIIKGSKYHYPLRTDRDQPPNKTPGLLKVKFPFFSGRITRKVSDHHESRLQRKVKKSQESVTTSRSAKIAPASKPKMTMKLSLKPLRRGIKLKQNVDILRRKKTKQ